jgi:Ala-tRNA(Pro) deacylase
MAAATWIENELKQRGVSYEEMHHREAYTAQEVAHQEHISGHRVAKVVVVNVDGRLVELVLPASRRVNLDRVRELLRANEVRLATEEEICQTFTDCEVGAIPPLPHWQGIEVMMDRSMQVPGDIVFQAGTHRDAIRLRFDDWFRMAEPFVASFTDPPEQW